MQIFSIGLWKGRGLLAFRHLIFFGEGMIRLFHWLYTFWIMSNQTSCSFCLRVWTVRSSLAASNMLLIFFIPKWILMFSRLSKHEHPLLQGNHCCLHFRAQSWISSHLEEQHRNWCRAMEVQIHPYSEQVCKYSCFRKESLWRIGFTLAAQMLQGVSPFIFHAGHILNKSTVFPATSKA